MPASRLYYQLKPYLPWRFRMALRRIMAHRKLKACQDVWPINEAAGNPPAGWPGWPDGKKFALVLTHDVEGTRGLSRCRQLMQLELQMGFRSSFNFVPEGEYSVSREFREELQENGFEVGVQDLKHDGKLFQNREAFRHGANQINRYMHEWGAVGFRSAFMFHNLEWAHDLDIDYSSCTFDTDPFEPQPDDVGTIFPFWVPAPDAQKSEVRNRQSAIGNRKSVQPSAAGYVELPYTLPQDSTLFFVLKEKSTAIWKKKLDWIVRRGGMALVNVHPDYVNFVGQKMASSEYPAVLYEQFLKYLRENYAGQYWNALPREVAGWYRQTCVEAPNRPYVEPAAGRCESDTEIVQKNSLKGKRAAIVLYSYYATDPRPHREAEALQQAGMEVEVICLRPSPASPWRQKLNGVDVFQMPLKRRRASKLVYIAQYAWFLICAFFFLSIRNFSRRYQLVHVHNMPDFLVFSALVPRLFGAKVILDLHDPMPELFRSIYSLPEEHFIVRWLKKMERRSIAFADLVLTPNLAFKELFVSRSCAPGKIEIVMNSPETTIFDPCKHPSVNGQPAADKPFVLMYHGLIVERHGLDLAVRACAQLRGRIPGLQLHMYGEPTDYSQEIAGLVRELQLESVVHAHGFKPLDEIARDISKIDLGLIPNRLSSFTQINFPTRIFEYLAMHKPVMVPGTKGIRDYFEEDEILYFEAGSVENLAAKIEWAYQHPAELQGLMERGLKIYERHNWNLQENRMVSLVARLIP